MRRVFRNRQQKKNALGFLLEKNPFAKDDNARVLMTVSCRDADRIRRAPGAGTIVKKHNESYQIMHNGILVLEDGYYGKWMTELITKLEGCHEPQEEKVFDAVIQRLRTENESREKVIVELGSFWCFYSLWFVSEFKNSKAICVEPDEKNMQVGKRNFAMNGLEKKASFVRACSGYGFGEKRPFISENSKDEVLLPVVAADWVADEYNVEKIDILHLDIQGFERQALAASEKAIRSGKVRYLFVSTHHYAFSKDPMTHEKCLKWIKDIGGAIIAQHNVLESYSGDGLIVASFDKKDKNFRVEVSRNTSADTLFRSYESDVATLIEYIDGRSGDNNW